MSKQEIMDNHWEAFLRHQKSSRKKGATQSYQFEEKEFWKWYAEEYL